MTGAAEAAESDLDRLIALKLGQPGTLGSPIDDPSESGPLGLLWPPGDADVEHPRVGSVKSAMRPMSRALEQETCVNLGNTTGSGR